MVNHVTAVYVSLAGSGNQKNHEEKVAPEHPKPIELAMKEWPTSIAARFFMSSFVGTSRYHGVMRPANIVSAKARLCWIRRELIPPRCPGAGVRAARHSAPSKRATSPDDLGVPASSRRFILVAPHRSRPSRCPIKKAQPRNTSAGLQRLADRHFLFCVSPSSVAFDSTLFSVRPSLPASSRCSILR